MVESIEENQIPKGNHLFEEEELQRLWNTGIAKDRVMREKLYAAIRNNDTQFASHLQLKVARAECELDLRGALCFRKQLWVPDWEPLQTALIQKTHDSHATGHPGRNNTIAILSRSFFWPGMSKMVRRFCKNVTYVEEQRYGAPSGRDCYCRYQCRNVSTASYPLTS